MIMMTNDFYMTRILQQQRINSQSIWMIMMLLFHQGYISIECYEIYDPNDQIADESIMSVENGLSVQHAKVNGNDDDVSLGFDCRNKTEGYYGDQHYCDMFHYCKLDGKGFTFVCPADNYFNQESIACEQMSVQQNGCRRNQSTSLTADPVTDSLLFMSISSTTLVPPTYSTTTITSNDNNKSLPNDGTMIELNATTSSATSNNSKPSFGFTMAPPMPTTIQTIRKRPTILPINDNDDDEDDQPFSLDQIDMSEFMLPQQLFELPSMMMPTQPSKDYHHSENNQSLIDDARQRLSHSIHRFLRDSVQLPSHYIRMVPRFWRQLQSSLLQQTSSADNDNSDDNSSSSLDKLSSNLAPVVWKSPHSSSTRLQQRFEEYKPSATVVASDNKPLSTLSIPVLIPINLTRDDYRQNMATSLLRPIVIPLKDHGKLVPAYVLQFNQHRLKKRSSLQSALAANKSGNNKDDDNNKANNGKNNSKKLLPKLAWRSGSLLTNLIPSILRNKLAKSLATNKQPKPSESSEDKIAMDSSLRMAAALANNAAWSPISIYGPWWTPESYAYLQQQLIKASESSGYDQINNNNDGGPMSASTSFNIPSSYHMKTESSEQINHQTHRPSSSHQSSSASATAKAKQLLKQSIKSIKSTNATSVNRRPKTSSGHQKQATIATNANVYVPDEVFDDFQISSSSNKDHMETGSYRGRSNGGHSKPNLNDNKDRGMMIVNYANGTTLRIAAKKPNADEDRNKSPNEPVDRFTSTVSASMMVARSPSLETSTTTSNRNGRIEHYESDMANTASKLMTESSSNHRRRI
ncbi:hypothetical protein DERP_006703 [Dermatophagoides pteronyssinus]|uniref:Chitin-binding type-2 domain-containing protein n=1 Tax=Dermatophagoides pteronyssinus TaxID=6956 RepID=A0ABQ8IRC2_DERPT|nr:hypothetical protein DERP_006703 [Dermatophagoides pteronyssinus]